MTREVAPRLIDTFTGVSTPMRKQIVINDQVTGSAFSARRYQYHKMHVVPEISADNDIMV